MTARAPWRRGVTLPSLALGLAAIATVIFAVGFAAGYAITVLAR